MNHKLKFFTRAAILGLFGLSVSNLNAIVLVINPDASGTPASGTPAYNDRFLPISQVTYEIGGASVTQSTEVTGGVVVVESRPVFVTQVVAGGRTLEFFNFTGAILRNSSGIFGQSNITINETGIGTVDHTGTQVKVSDGKAAFDAALTATTQNNNILDYIYYDGSVGTTPDAPYDYDMLFTRGLEASDAFLIQERNGNTFFRIDALGADGNVIAGANALVFGGTSDDQTEQGGTPLTRYDWNSGYASTYDDDQPIVFTVAETSVFFAGTSVATSDQIVYGFRIDNNGNADVKFFGLGDDPFENNPPNPVPEPSAFAGMLGVAALLLVARRRSIKA